jgi:hypothetical protein
MIWDSEPWKRELARLAARLRRHAKQGWTEDTSTFVLERDLFYAAYVVRKLMEACKLSDEVEALHTSAVEHEPTTRGPDLMNWHHFDRMFDLSKGAQRSIGWKEFCNQFIHSFIFSPVVDDNTFAIVGVFVASEFQKKRSLLYFELADVISLFRTLSRDDIATFQYERDSVTKELRVVKKSSILPKSIVLPR